VSPPEPSCRYGAVFHASRNVGVSIPVSGPPRREPLVGFSVPMSCSTLVLLSVNAVPEWHAAQFSRRNTFLPAAPAVVSVPVCVAIRAPAELVQRSDVGAASASRSALRPAFGSPSGRLRVPVVEGGIRHHPVPPSSARIWPSKSCTSSKFELQCKPAVRRRPSAQIDRIAEPLAHAGQIPDATVLPAVVVTGSAAHVAVARHARIASVVEQLLAVSTGAPSFSVAMAVSVAICTAVH